MNELKCVRAQEKQHQLQNESNLELEINQADREIIAAEYVLTV